MKSNTEIAMTARQILSGQWNRVAALILGWCVFALLVSALFRLVPFIGILGSILVSILASFGAHKLGLALARREPISWRVFWNFSGRWGSLIALYLFSWLLIWGGFILLIIPGVLATYSYYLIQFVWMDHPELTVRQIFKRSRMLMAGYRWQLFRLHLRLIGWYLLGLVTFGIALLWVAPYAWTQVSLFYEARKAAVPID